MKKLLILSTLLLLSNFITAQDTITTQNNRVIVAKIMEVTPTTLKYKKFDMPDGPDFILERSTVKKIVYKNGTVEVIDPIPATTVGTPVAPAPPVAEASYKFVKFDNTYMYNNMRVGENRMYRIMNKKNDPELYSLTRKAKKANVLRFVGLAAIPAAAYAAFGLTLGAIEEDGFFIGVGAVAAVATIGFTATGIIGNIRHKKMRAKAVALYNQKY